MSSSLSPSESAGGTSSPTASPPPSGGASSTSAGGGGGGGGGSSSAAPPRVRRRNRLITSCLECRRRKLKCDKTNPCANCRKWHRQCLFIPASGDAAAQARMAEVKERIAGVERSLEENVARGKYPADSDEEDEYGAQRVQEEDREFKEIRPTPLGSNDVVYDQDAEDDDLLDLGVQLGKMRLNERIGGIARPRFGEELAGTLRTPYNLLEPAATPADKTEGARLMGMPNKYLQDWRKRHFIGPSPDFVSPSSGFFFVGAGGGNSSKDLFMGGRNRIADFLPSQAAGDLLLQQYWTAVHPLCRVLHRQSFEQRYEMFWQHMNTGVEPPPSLQAIVLAVYFTATVSLDETTILDNFGTEKKTLTDNFRQGTEMALEKANFLRTAKIETIQALVAFLLAQCRGEISRAHSVLTGLAIRLAECIGLHRDGTVYGLPAIETHVRRLLWHQLCFLDIRTAEMAGPRPQIRTREENGYDAKFPLNVDDADLMGPNPATKDNDRFSELTICVMRFRCTEIIRKTRRDIPRIDAGRSTITSALRNVQKYIRDMESRYEKFFDDSDDMRVFARHIYRLSIDRQYTLLLHRYHNSVATRIPDRLRQLILSSGTSQMEHAIAIDTDATCAPWRWYMGAIQSYQVALLLLVEIHGYPMRKEADRIWTCLEYIFDLGLPGVRDLSRPQKARLVLAELGSRMREFHRRRQTRVPTEMEKVVGMMSPHAVGGVGGYQNPVQGIAPTVRPTVAPAPSPNNVNAFIPTPQQAAAPLSGLSVGGADMDLGMDGLMATTAGTTSAPLQPDVTTNLLDPTGMATSNSNSGGFGQNFVPNVPLAALARGGTTANAAAATPGMFMQATPSPNPNPNVMQSHTTSPAMANVPAMANAVRHFSPEGSMSPPHGMSPPPGLGSESGGSSAVGGASPAFLMSVSNDPFGVTNENLPMMDVDWNEFDQMFPPDVYTGELNVPNFSFQAYNQGGQTQIM